MSNFIIMSDSACDMKLETLKKWNVKIIDLSLTFVSDSKVLLNSEIDIKDFYQRMRNGEVAKTSAINVEQFKMVFDEILAKGEDILYLGFSSGLSTTFNSARLAAEELKEKYPNNKIEVVDSLCASAGQGLLLYLACKKRDEGNTLEEVKRFLEDNKLNICHWFTVNDLVYLKRGGRISPTTALIGSLLGIKPILHVDNEGHLISKAKVRGRKASISAIVQKYGELVKKIKEGPVFICHGDCIEDVKFMQKLLKEKYDVEVDEIVNTGPVIGAHSGPGTLALFFVGKER